MNLRQAKAFNKFYSRNKKPKKRFVAARGEWSGAPELGLSSSELRGKAKKARMRVNQYRKYMMKLKRKGGAPKPKPKDRFTQDNSRWKQDNSRWNRKDSRFK